MSIMNWLNASVCPKYAIFLWLNKHGKGKKKQKEFRSPRNVWMQNKTVLLIRFFLLHRIFAQNYCHNLEVFKEFVIPSYFSSFVRCCVVFFFVFFYSLSIRLVFFALFLAKCCLSFGFMRMCVTRVNHIIVINVDFVIVYAYGFCGILDVYIATLCCCCCCCRWRRHSLILFAIILLYDAKKIWIFFHSI